MQNDSCNACFNHGNLFIVINATQFNTVLIKVIYIQSRLAIRCLVIKRIGYNVVSRGPRISAARGKMGTTANNNAVINCHLFL